jgi:hypothetical protein
MEQQHEGEDHAQQQLAFVVEAPDGRISGLHDDSLLLTCMDMIAVCGCGQRTVRGAVQSKA